MAESKKGETSYFQELLHFYFAPGIRSIATIFYLVIFGYFSLYYIDSVFLAMKFLWYVVFGSTALQGIAFLFTGMAFVICLVFPFSISVYSIFVLHTIWAKSSWKTLTKWIMSIIVAIGSFLIIMTADEGAKAAARQPAMQSFVEDHNLTGRI